MHRRIPAGIEFRRSSAGLGGDPPYPPLLRGEKKGGSFGIAIARSNLQLLRVNRAGNPTEATNENKIKIAMGE